ncbi:MAG: sugar transporter [Lasallia pustulata]|uniref:Sugar transporter n=1 Tax=Lasallia pustulata TaxID=136370 RepID=A0A5M8PP96_9LECA|nr:MAG: sugar transporter [Lasallia pustulata]
MDRPVPRIQDSSGRSQREDNRRTPYTYNVLSGMNHAELLKDVDNFAQQHNLADKRSILQTGALLAQDRFLYDQITTLKASSPGVYDSLYTPTIRDVQALRDEISNPWHHKKQIPRTIVLCSIGAAVQGWDQTAANGANLRWPSALNIPGGGNGALFGLVNAAPWMSAGLLGCWLSDPLNFYSGRRGCIFLGAIFCILPIIGSAFAQKWQHLLICRLLLGLGIGLKATTIPVYMAENSPKSIRGALVMTWQLCVAFGIFLGSSVNLIVPNHWRLQLGSALIPAVPLLVGIYFCPESPRWYIKKRRYQDAYRSLKRLRNTKLQAARDLYYIHKQLHDQKCATSRSIRRSFSARNATFHVRQTSRGLRSYLVRLWELFVVDRIRQATLASFTVMIAQQICGINIIAFYASTIFAYVSTGKPIAQNSNDQNPRPVLWYSFGYGIANFLFAFPALYTIDRWGRRTLLLITFPLLAMSLLVAGLCSLLSNHDIRIGLVATFVIIYTAIYSTGEGPVPFTYSAEVFPLSHREIGMSFAVATNFIFAAILSVTFPSMLDRFRPAGAFVFYASLNVIAFIMIFLLVPETRQRTLEDLDYIFDKPIKEFARESIQGLELHRAKNCKRFALSTPKITRRFTD